MKAMCVGVDHERNALLIAQWNLHFCYACWAVVSDE